MDFARTCAVASTAAAMLFLLAVTAGLLAPCRDSCTTTVVGQSSETIRSGRTGEGAAELVKRHRDQ